MTQSLCNQPPPIAFVLNCSCYCTALLHAFICSCIWLSKDFVAFVFFRIMSDSIAKEPEAPPNPQAAVTDPTPVAEGPPDASFGEQNLSFTTTDLNLVEMTEIEYTQLQHILYSHMEAQANEHETENRLNSNCFSTNSSANQPQYLSSCNSSQSGFSSNSSGNQSLYPIICQSGLTSDSSFMGPNQCLGHIDFQELRMMLLSESNLPPNQAEKTPNGSSVDAAGQNLVKVKHSESLGGIIKENVLVENSAPVPESRAKSAVRVRLEDRFSSIQTDIPRGQEAQETGVAINKCVSFIFPFKYIVQSSMLTPVSRILKILEYIYQIVLGLLYSVILCSKLKFGF